MSAASPRGIPSAPAREAADEVDADLVGGAVERMRDLRRRRRGRRRRPLARWA